MTTFLNRLIRLPRRARASHLSVTVYTRRQCCCCHAALDVLRDAQRTHGFSIDTIDIDTDPALVAAHGLSIPVVAIDGKVRFRGVVNPALLDRLLMAEAEAEAKTSRDQHEGN